MESLRVKIGLVFGLMGLALVGQGCVPWSKFIKIKKENERLLADLSEKDRIIGDEASRLQALRDQLNAANQLIELYKRKFGGAEELASKTSAELARLQQKLDELGKIPGVEAGRGKLMVKDTLLFALGSAEISEPGRKLLARLANEFKEMKEFTLQVEGHTDDHRVARPETVQRYGDNWGLSAARAYAVIRVLAKNGVAEPSLQGAFYSMWRPRAAPLNVNDEASRSKNRRVEFLFIPGPSGAPAIQPGPLETDTAPAPERTPEPPKPEPVKAEPAKAEPAKAPTPPANPEPKKE